jgi:DNA-binding NarL/FixJ family response regulator
MPISVFLADDHAVVRDGLRAILEAQGDIVVVGEAADGRETVRQARQVRPDVVVMDIAMPGLNGIEAGQQIRETCPATQIVILSVYATSEHIFRALQSGAEDLLKEAAGQEVVAVRTVRWSPPPEPTNHRHRHSGYVQQRQGAPASVHWSA